MKKAIGLVTLYILVSAISPPAWAFDCTYGNSDQTATNWTPVDPDLPGSYAYLIYPGDDACGNGVGFSVSAVRILLAVQSGGSFDIQASILEAVEGDGGCLTPGVTIETSEPSHISGWPDVGGIDVGVYGEFSCLPADRAYFLSIEFLAVDAEVLFPRTPDMTFCTSYLDQGSGFSDLQDFDGGGGLVLFCNANNCDNPSPTSQSNWGHIKALYRD